MTTQEMLVLAVKDLLTSDVVDSIARDLVRSAKGGDHDAMKLVMGFAAMAEKLPGHCDHPEDRREVIPQQTMGGGPLREVCACGAMLEDGKQVEE